MSLFISIGEKTMAAERTCDSSMVSSKLLKEYQEGSIDTSKYSKIDENTLEELIVRGEQVCVIHDRINDLIHSYSITLYKTPVKNKLYLIFEGGFGGNEQFGFGPIF